MLGKNNGIKPWEGKKFGKSSKAGRRLHWQTRNALGCVTRTDNKLINVKETTGQEKLLWQPWEGQTAG